MINICYRFEVFILILVSSLASLGSTLDCYSCERFIDDPHCGDPFVQNVPLAECTNSEVCIKQKTLPIAIKINFPVLPKFIRGCGPRGYCDKVEHLSVYCSECPTDLCNSSAVAIPCLVVVCLLCFTMYLL